MDESQPTQDDLDALEEGWPEPSGAPAQMVDYKPKDDPWGEEEEGCDLLAELIAAGRTQA